MDEDAELIERFLRGDREAGSRLVARHSQALFCWLRWKTGCREDAEDLTQSVWQRAIPALARLEDRTHFRAWLFTIMRREFLHWLRDHRPTCSLDALCEQGGNGIEGKTLTDLLTEHVSDTMNAVDERLALQHALSQLSEEHRDTFMLRYLSQFSTAEVARILEVPVGTVESRCHFARERLRAWLQQPGESQNIPAPPTRDARRPAGDAAAQRTQQDTEGGFANTPVAQGTQDNEPGFRGYAK